MTEISHHIGNLRLLKLPKTAFLCSRKVPASIVLKCYDWAIQQREQGNCVISGFHSQIEKDVLHYLLKGKQPIIVALARGLKKKLEPEFVKPLNEGRLLIITPFENDVRKITQETAAVRNQMMIELADSVVVGYLEAGGLLNKCLQGIVKEVNYINSGNI
jgi:predicted Rossmann fold nucleotide-binding protein DprA/Smf involved in DNA uptake